MEVTGGCVSGENGKLLKLCAPDAGTNLMGNAGWQCGLGEGTVWA